MTSVLLAIDAGNSSVKVGLFERSKLIGRWGLPTVCSHTAREWSDLIRSLSSSTAMVENLEGIVIASVVPVLDAPLAAMGERHFGVETLFVTPDTDTGLKVRYDNPGELGVDRLVNSVAAFHRYGGPALIVDLGTAINFDIVSAEGEFLGGLICPGIEMGLQALHAKTARLPMVDFRRPASLIGTNTIRCIRAGTYYGLAGMIDGVVERVIAEFGGKITVIATGGDAQKIALESRLIEEINEDLTLEGLETIWRRKYSAVPPTASASLDSKQTRSFCNATEVYNRKENPCARALQPNTEIAGKPDWSAEYAFPKAIFA